MAKRSIEGKRAVITGASSGIGRALAVELGRRGGKLVLVARRGDRLGEVAADVRAAGGSAECIVGDVAEDAVRQRLVDVAREVYGGLDVLVNNAATSALGPFGEASPDRLRRIMEVNFFAVAEMTRLALPVLKEGREPMVVNIASILSHVAVPHLTEYCAAKFAVRGFSEALRAEVRPDGVDVLVVSPGTVETEIWDRMIEVRGPALWRARRGVTAEFVARKIARAMQQGKREVFPGVGPKFVHFMHQLSPDLVSWVIERRRE